MQAAAQQGIVEAARVASFWAVLWAGSATCPLVHVRCPDCFCGDAAKAVVGRSDVAGWGGFSVFLAFFIGVTVGVATSFAAYLYTRVSLVPLGRGRIVRGQHDVLRLA